MTRSQRKKMFYIFRTNLEIRNVDIEPFSLLAFDYTIWSNLHGAEKCLCRYVRNVNIITNIY